MRGPSLVSNGPTARPAALAIDRFAAIVDNTTRRRGAAGPAIPGTGSSPSRPRVEAAIRPGRRQGGRTAMRTEPPSPLASALARLRAPAGRARRWLAARGTADPGRPAPGRARRPRGGGLPRLGRRPLRPRAWAWIYEGRRLSGRRRPRPSPRRSTPRASPTSPTPPAGSASAPTARPRPSPPWPSARSSPRTLDELSRDAEAASLLGGPRRARAPRAGPAGAGAEGP